MSNKKKNKNSSIEIDNVVQMDAVGSGVKKKSRQVGRAEQRELAKSAKKMLKNKDGRNPATIPVSLALLQKHTDNIYVDMRMLEQSLSQGQREMDDSLRVLLVTCLRKGLITEEDLQQTVDEMNAEIAETRKLDINSNASGCDDLDILKQDHEPLFTPQEWAKQDGKFIVDGGVYGDNWDKRISFHEFEKHYSQCTVAPLKEIVYAGVEGRNEATGE